MPSRYPGAAQHLRWKWRDEGGIAFSAAARRAIQTRRHGTTYRVLLQGRGASWSKQKTNIASKAKEKSKNCKYRKMTTAYSMARFTTEGRGFVPVHIYIYIYIDRLFLFFGFGGLVCWLVRLLCGASCLFIYVYIDFLGVGWLPVSIYRLSFLGGLVGGWFVCGVGTDIMCRPRVLYTHPPTTSCHTAETKEDINKCKKKDRRTRQRLGLDGLDGRLQLARLAQLPAHHRYFQGVHTAFCQTTTVSGWMIRWYHIY